MTVNKREEKEKKKMEEEEKEKTMTGCLLHSHPRGNQTIAETGSAIGSRRKREGRERNRRINRQTEKAVWDPVARGPCSGSPSIQTLQSSAVSRYTEALSS